MCYNIDGDFMSTSEYNDLFIKCQDTGIYHIFTFDIKNSKKMIKEQRLIVQYRLIELAIMMYKMIQEIELRKNKKILVFGNDFTKLNESRLNMFGYKQEPFIYGDVIGFTVYRDSIRNEEVMEIFNKCKKALNINFEFHLADGYYETNNWEEGNEKYFRGYCIDLLSNLHKPYNKAVRKVLGKSKKI